MRDPLDMYIIRLFLLFLVIFAFKIIEPSDQVPRRKAPAPPFITYHTPAR